MTLRDVANEFQGVGQGRFILILFDSVWAQIWNNGKCFWEKVNVRVQWYWVKLVSIFHFRLAFFLGYGICKQRVSAGCSTQYVLSLSLTMAGTLLDIVTVKANNFSFITHGITEFDIITVNTRLAAIHFCGMYNTVCTLASIHNGIHATWHCYRQGKFILNQFYLAHTNG